MQYYFVSAQGINEICSFSGKNSKRKTGNHSLIQTKPRLECDSH